ncbi:hypothetical protein LCGC14_0163710 [marine sediment metagenome]|uniref:Uncharacterized protein n=1 Tax=marine sediment metagenome TaxID=412755 RepID=A0A0F9VAC6_9ZZZZ
MPPKFPLPDAPVSSDAVLSDVLSRSDIIIGRVAARFARITRDPSLCQDDYYQYGVMVLLEWISGHRPETLAMLASDENHLEKFVQIFCQRRMDDMWETTRAEGRDAGKTWNVNNEISDRPDGRGQIGYMDTLNNYEVDYASIDRVDQYRDGLRPLARRIIDVLLNPPAALQENFLSQRTKRAYGDVEIVASQERYGLSRMNVEPREGYTSTGYTITWEGPLAGGVIETSHGNMTVSDDTDMWRLEFEFKLIVLSDGYHGEYEQLTVRPTPACFDLKALARYLSGVKGKRIPNCHVAEAWVEATTRYHALFGGDLVTEPTGPGRLVEAVA